MTGKVGKPGPDLVDIAVGLRVRERRRAIGVSQSDLAKQVGVTFQQIQKYERGANRISSSMLVRIARVLEATVQDLVDPTGDLAPDAVQLLAVFNKIDSKRGRTAVLEIARIIAGLV